LFEEVANPEDLELIFAIESMTNDRLRDQIGDLLLVASEKRVSGPGSSPIMAAFTHIGYPSRFTSGESYGVYYGAKDIKTALKETIYHREILLRTTDEPDTDLTMRCYVNQVSSELHDIRGKEFSQYHQEDYQAPQTFAATMRAKGSDGLIFNSVRDPGGECVAIFSPNALTMTTQSGHYQYQWRNKENRIVNVLKLSQVDF
jgi:hypothetical protein